MRVVNLQPIQNNNKIFMRSFFISILTIFVFASCGQTQNGNVNIPMGSKQKTSAKESVATFSEGCFWHSEIVFQSLVGVRDAVSGYCGGTVANPDYEKVSTGT